MFKSILAIAVMGAFAAPASAADDDAPDQRVTFSKEVVRIFQENCQTCHRPGDVAPMSLMTYEEARPWAKSIKKAVTDRTMPPWFAGPGSHAFRNDTSLSDEEIAAIVKWVDSGAPEGNRADLPEPKVFATGDGWKLKEPELIFEYPEPYLLGKDVDDEYRCFVMSLPTDHDVWLKGVEYRPGNRAVVHHYIVFIDESGRTTEIDKATPEPGFECGMGGGGVGMMKMVSAWAPGNNDELAPEGIAFKIKKGSNIVLQTHYHNTTGEDQLEQTKMAFHLAKEKIIKEPRINLVSAWQLNIKAGDPASRHEAKLTAMKDMTVGSVAPHMHYRGKSMKVWYALPGKQEKLLIDLPRWDFNWQLTYELVEPLAAPKGTVFRMESIHDNSADNPFNPANPPIDVTWGEETDREMAIAFLGITFDDENLNVEPVYPIQLADWAKSGTATGGR